MKVLNLSLMLLLSIFLSCNIDTVAKETGNTEIAEIITNSKKTDLSKRTVKLDEPPKLMAIKFHADWCGSCKAIGPAITDLSNKLDGQPVLFTELDFTNITTKNQATLMAHALGISDVVKNNNGTGFILVIDSNTKQVKAKLNKTQSVKEMGKIISDLL